MQHDGEKYVVVAKEYAYQNKASFIEPVAKHAIGNWQKLIFYQSNTEEITVFGPDAVRREGSASSGASKKDDASWIEIPKKCGQTLDAYLSGEVNQADGQQSITNWT